jgi:6,7-dimethyl-8-ribityllumazine synthase
MAGRPRALIIVARFYPEISDNLIEGAVARLEAANVVFETLEVPGVLEIPPALAMALTTARRADRSFDMFIMLGCVIRGETSHYDHVCVEAARGLQDLAAGARLAIGFGLLTCETGAQARVRADPAGKDAGGRAARACLRMIEIRREFGLDDRG